MDENPWMEDERLSDKYVQNAQDQLQRFLSEHSREVFYLKQLQVIFEKQFFHWVTYTALDQLAAEGVVGDELVTSERGTQVRLFFWRGHRFRKRQASRLLQIVDEMANPELARACGEQAEMLFFNALANRGFAACGEDVREYGGRVWRKTDHNLDFIIERDGVAYGSEVKNRWDYMNREELETKLEMCAHIGVKPLFIVRASPKSYNKTIIDAGGYVMVFEAHIYPFGMKEFGETVRKELGLMADSPKAIPAGIIDRFEKWHRRTASGGVN